MPEAGCRCWWGEPGNISGLSFRDGRCPKWSRTQACAKPWKTGRRRLAEMDCTSDWPAWTHRRQPGSMPRNLRRTVRALEVILSSGRRFSEQRQSQPSPYRLLLLGLTRPRPELYQRIDARIQMMIDAGLVDEVRDIVESEAIRLTCRLYRRSVTAR